MGGWERYPKGYWEKQLFCTKQIQYLFYSRFTHRKVLFYLLCPKQTKITKLRIMFQFCVIFTLPLAEFKLGAVSLGKCDLSLYWIFLGLGIFSFKLSGKTKIGSETADFYNSVKIILKLLCSVSFGLNWSHNKKENKLVFAELPKINTQKK